MTSKEKVALLRSAMQKENIDAFIVFSADPHMSEYLPEEWLERAWLSGFTGSAGFVVVTQNKAALWTDGRYFVQAPKELEGSDFILMKEGADDTPHFISWLKSEIEEGGTVAVNALATSNTNWSDLEQKLAAKNITVIDRALLQDIWTERTALKTKREIFVHPEDRAGKSTTSKLADIREKLRENNADFHIITSLDDVAWTLNLRGSDVDYNPVFLGFLTISENEAKLYVKQEKLTADAKDHLEKSDVLTEDYDNFYSQLEKVHGKKVLISPNSNQKIFATLKNDNEFVLAPVPGNLMKAQKNETELQGFRNAMQRDGAAMVKFLYWLVHDAAKEGHTEFTIGEKLREFRAQGEHFVGESFGSIVGYKGNGAIVHYSAKKETAAKVENDGSILVDSGGQYLDGTTDITRTLALGAVSEEFKRNSTLVLQGMIRLSMVKFPKGTRGVQLDSVARMPLWLDGKDYAHGTGHGVGSFMNVHEGPQNIRKDMNAQELLPGMVCSNEPGFYVENQYGIRHENLVAVKEAESTDFGTFCEFETLTICPFFTDTVVKEILQSEELEWLNNYHAWCREKLEDLLEGAVKEWFLKLVAPI